MTGFELQKTFECVLREICNQDNPNAEFDLTVQISDYNKDKVWNLGKITKVFYCMESAKISGKNKAQLVLTFSNM